MIAVSAIAIKGNVREITDEDVRGLASSVADRGFLHLLEARPSGSREKPYELVFGHRRLRAAQLAGVTEVPCVIRKMNDREALEDQLTENLQRKDLNDVEQAILFRNYLEKTEKSQGELATLIGKDPSFVSNQIRLLGLGEAAQDLIRHGMFGSGHGKVLLKIPAETHALQDELARRAARQGLSVKALEGLVDLELAKLERPKQAVRDPPRLGEPDKKAKRGKGAKSEEWAERVFEVQVRCHVLASDQDEAVDKTMKAMGTIPAGLLLSKSVGPAHVDWHETARRKKAEQAEAAHAKGSKPTKRAGGGR